MSFPIELSWKKVDHNVMFLFLVLKFNSVYLTSILMQNHKVPVLYLKCKLWNWDVLDLWFLSFCGGESWLATWDLESQWKQIPRVSLRDYLDSIKEVERPTLMWAVPLGDLRLSHLRKWAKNQHLQPSPQTMVQATSCCKLLPWRLHRPWWRLHRPWWTVPFFGLWDKISLQVTFA